MEFEKLLKNTTSQNAKAHQRVVGWLNDIMKKCSTNSAKHEAERDDAIQAARVGMKMAEVVINDDDKARAALRSIPEHAVKMAQLCAEAERYIIDEFGIKPLIETRELIKKRMKK